MKMPNTYLETCSKVNLFFLETGHVAGTQLHNPNFFEGLICLLACSVHFVRRRVGDL